MSNKPLFTFSSTVCRFLFGPLKPGCYEITPESGYFSIAKQMCRGRAATITVPEGYTQREVAVLISKRLDIGDSPFLEKLEKMIPDYEGRLYPATYPVMSPDPEQIIQEMLRTFETRTAKLKPARDDIILASILQKECERTDEFRKVSGVFHNRLKAGMMLESDPTLQYVVGRIRLTEEVLKNRSPYNTYMYRGLPPGPICNPSIEAVWAAMNPSTHPYLYFVSKRNGYHFFSKTKIEHFRAVGYYQLGYKKGFKPEDEEEARGRGVERSGR